MTERIDLSNLKPAQPRQERKRIGRGLGSGKGRYSGRGIKGQKSRAGSHKMTAGFEGGQMPIDMRLGKLRGNTSADARAIGPFRTYSQPVNLRDLEDRFEAGAEVTPDSLVAAGLLKNTKTDIKILASGDLTKKLVVSAHGFSKTARQKIEAAGGSIVWLKGEPEIRAPGARISKKKKKRKATAEAEEAGEVVESSEAEEASE